MSADEKVFTFLRDHLGQRFSSGRLAKELNLWSGTLYPALLRLEKEDRVRSDWEWPNKLARARRRLYWVETP